MQPARSLWVSARSAPLTAWVALSAIVLAGLIANWVIGPARTRHDLARCRELYGRARTAADSLVVDSLPVRATVPKGTYIYPDARCSALRAPGPR